VASTVLISVWLTRHTGRWQFDCRSAVINGLNPGLILVATTSSRADCGSPSGAVVDIFFGPMALHWLIPGAVFPKPADAAGRHTTCSD
jgi:hypothetical protein